MEKFRSMTVKLPRFDDGRVDFTNAGYAFVLSCFIKFQNEILLLKRSNQVSTHQGKWHTVAGYIDEEIDLKAKALKELNEEIGLTEDLIDSFVFGEPYERLDSSVNRTWHVYPILANLKTRPKITLDFEHTEYQWMQLKNIDKLDLDLVPNFKLSLAKVMRSKYI